MIRLNKTALVAAETATNFARQMLAALTLALVAVFATGSAMAGNDGDDGNVVIQCLGTGVCAPYIDQSVTVIQQMQVVESPMASCKTTGACEMPVNSPPPPSMNLVCIWVDSADNAFVKMREGRSLSSRVLWEQAAGEMHWERMPNGRFQGEFCYDPIVVPEGYGASLCSPSENNYLDPATMAYIKENGGVGRDDPAVLAY